MPYKVEVSAKIGNMQKSNNNMNLFANSGENEVSLKFYAHQKPRK